MLAVFSCLIGDLTNYHSAIYYIGDRSTHQTPNKSLQSFDFQHAYFPTFSGALVGGEDVVEGVGLDGVGHRFPFDDPYLVRGERGRRGEGGGVGGDWALTTCVHVRCLCVWLRG